MLSPLSSATTSTEWNNGYSGEEGMRCAFGSTNTNPASGGTLYGSGLSRHIGGEPAIPQASAHSRALKVRQETHQV